MKKLERRGFIIGKLLITTGYLSSRSPMIDTCFSRVTSGRKFKGKMIRLFSRRIGLVIAWEIRLPVSESTREDDPSRASDPKSENPAPCSSGEPVAPDSAPQHQPAALSE